MPDIYDNPNFIKTFEAVEHSLKGYEILKGLVYPNMPSFSMSHDDWSSCCERWISSDGKHTLTVNLCDENFQVCLSSNNTDYNNSTVVSSKEKVVQFIFIYLSESQDAKDYFA